MSKRLDVATVVVWGSIGICFVIFLALTVGGGFYLNGGAGIWTFLAYSSRVFGASFLECLDQLALLLFLFVVVLAFWGIMKRFVSLFWKDRKLHRLIEDSDRHLLALVRDTALRLWHAVGELIPVAILLILVSLIFSEANSLDKFRLGDLMVISWEHALTGTYVFAALGGLHLPNVVAVFIIGCFVNVAVIVILPALFVGYATPKVFQELITAFCIGTMILVPLWLILPALSPQDRFIDNAYRLPVPPGLALAVANYHPQPTIADFLQTVRTEKAGLPDLPTTTVPSAHIFWLGIAGYYFFKSKKWLGWIMLPFLVASACGTVLLAQHYLFDVIASLVIVAISVAAAKKVIVTD